MLLAIDIGNTNITLGIWDGNKWRQQWRLATATANTADEYGIMLRSLLKEFDLFNLLDAVIFCSVVPVLSSTFSAACQRYLELMPVEIGLHLNLGVRVETDVPEAVGTDRIVNAVAVNTLYPGAAITVDMGTATKLDVITAAGELVGGVIAPGLRLAADALVARAAKLSHVALEAPPQVLGRNTTQAMQSGLIFGYTSMIEGLLQRLCSEHPDRHQPIRVIGTGGLIDLIAPHTKAFNVVNPALTLEGLRIIYQREQEKTA